MTHTGCSPLLRFGKVTPDSWFLKEGSQINPPSLKASVVYFDFVFEVVHEDITVGD